MILQVYTQQTTIYTLYTLNNIQWFSIPTNNGLVFHPLYNILQILFVFSALNPAGDEMDEGFLGWTPEILGMGFEVVYETFQVI